MNHGFKNPVSLKPVLVTGATGYVGGRLAPLLLESGYRIRVMGRSLSKLECRPWASSPNAELVQADVFGVDSLKKAAKGCRAAFYLIHSMNPNQKDFARADRAAARNMVEAAVAAGLEKIIYLGGLGDDGPSLSEHLKSRTEVAKILQSGSVPTTFLRAAMILGSGGASFEVLRYLVERLPVMTTPRWVRTPCQPIAIRNVLNYLKGCLEHDETTGQSFDIGGPDILTYQELMGIYAREAGLRKRWIIPVPVLTPRLSSYWIHLVTPVHSSIAKPLAEGLRNPAVCRENRIRSIIPQELLTCQQAIRLAMERVQQQKIETSWSDAGMPRTPEWLYYGDAPYAGGTIFECGYRIIIEASPEEVWKPIARIGGQTGWYFADFLWVLRGAMDSFMGGIALSRGRRHPSELYNGDALDFWRVINVEKPHHLMLLAEMKTPGEAIMEFRLHQLDNGHTELQQFARFRPKGLFGILYWYLLYPFHKMIYKGMLKESSKTIGKPVSQPPERFAPGRYHICNVDPRLPPAKQ